MSEVNIFLCLKTSVAYFLLDLSMEVCVNLDSSYSGFEGFWLLWLPQTSNFSSDTFVQTVGCFLRDYFLNIYLLLVSSLWAVP